MAMKSVPVQNSGARSVVELSAEISDLKARSMERMDRTSKASILIGYIYAVADVLTTASHNDEMRDGLGKDTLEQLQWLQLELSEQAGAVIDGYMPPSVPSHEHTWVEVDRGAS